MLKVTEFGVKDWVVVAFPTSTDDETGRYIDQIIKSRKGRLIENFLRPKFTKKYTGCLPISTTVCEGYCQFHQ